MKDILDNEIYINAYIIYLKVSGSDILSVYGKVIDMNDNVLICKMRYRSKVSRISNENKVLVVSYDKMLELCPEIVENGE